MLNQVHLEESRAVKRATAWQQEESARKICGCMHLLPLFPTTGIIRVPNSDKMYSWDGDRQEEAESCVHLSSLQLLTT